MSTTNTTSYLVELDRWGIKSNKTDAINTTNGINNALKWASQNGYTECILPYGQYLISETSSINMVSNMTLNLNNSTLKVNPNGLKGYTIVLFNNVKNSKLCNGSVKGDRYEHNYNPNVDATHESGYGIGFGSGTEYCYAENLEVSECTGDSITVGQFGTSKYETYVTVSNIELGDYSNNGIKQSSTTKVRTITPIQLSNNDYTNLGYFRLTGHAYWGNGSLTYPYYDIFFYDANNSLISFSRKVELYEKKPIPNGTKSVHLAFYQSTKTAFNVDHFIWIKLTMPPQNIYIQYNKLFDSRRCGLSLGGSNINIINNEIYNINGVLPQCGIDMEEGWGANRDLRIINNYIHDTRRGIILISGINAIVRDNLLERNEVCGISVSTGGANISNNRFNKANVIMQSKEISTFSNNSLKMSELSLNFEGAVIVGCTFANSYIRDLGQLSKPIVVDNCIFKADSMSEVNFITINDKTDKCHTIKNSTFNGFGPISQRSINKVDTAASKLVIDNCTFDNTAAVYIHNTSIYNSTFIGTNLFISNSISMTKPFETKVIHNKFNINNDQQGYYNPILITDLSTPRQIVYLKDNLFQINSNMTEDIIKLERCKEFIFQGNMAYDNFTSTSKTFIKYWNSIMDRAVIEDNTFTSNYASPYAYDTSWSTKFYTIFKNNSLVNYRTIIKNYDKLYNKFGPSTARPAGIEVGYEYFDTTLGKPLWVKVSGDGYSSSSNSLRNTSYKVGITIYEGLKIYECTTAGTTGSTAPQWNITKDSTTVDGTVIWTCRGDRTIWVDSTGKDS